MGTEPDSGADRQTDQRKEGGLGGRRVSGALNRPRRAQEATGWGLAAPGGQREGGGGHRGRDAGLTMARRGAASDARAGGAGRAAASLPPLASRWIWLGDSSGRGGGSARSGSQAAGPRQGGPRRPPLPAPPLSARLRLRAGPPAGTPSTAGSLSAASPAPTAGQPRCPATFFLPLLTLQWVPLPWSSDARPAEDAPLFPPPPASQRGQFSLHKGLSIGWGVREFSGVPSRGLGSFGGPKPLVSNSLGNLFSSRLPDFGSTWSSEETTGPLPNSGGAEGREIRGFFPPSRDSPAVFPSHLLRPQAFRLRQWAPLCGLGRARAAVGGN